MLRWQVIPIALLSCVGCADRDPLPDAPRSPAPVMVESQAVGCYEHVPGERPMRHLPPWEMPRTFYLTNDLHGYLTNDRWGAVATHGRPVALRWVRHVDSYRATGIWLLERPNTIHIRLQGLWVTLRRGSSDEVWRGQPTKWSNDGTTTPGVDVSVRRVSDSDCDSFR